MKKIIYTVGLLLGGIASFQAQVIVGDEEASPEKIKSYSVLDIKSVNSDKALQVPVVAITDLTSKTTPVKNPVDGMVVYNINSSRPLGLHFWDAKRNGGQGMWIQLADTSNMINAALIETEQPYNIMDGKPLGEHENLLAVAKDTKVVVNRIGLKGVKGVKTTDAAAILKGDSGYFVTLTLELKSLFRGVTNPETKGIDGTDLYQHQYVIDLWGTEDNGVTWRNYGAPQYVNVNSRANKNDNKYTVNVAFSFPVIRNDVKLYPRIAYENVARNADGTLTNGGNYYLGKPEGNTGAFQVSKVYMMIERGILAQ